MRLLPLVATSIMRTPHRRRAMVRVIAPPPQGIALAVLAQESRYVGSPEHKDVPSFAGHPRPRADASICEASFVNRLQELNRWLRQSMERGFVGSPWEGRFPRYVWHREGDVVYEARLVNRAAGEYKGYALTPAEWPEGV